MAESVLKWNWSTLRQVLPTLPAILVIKLSERTSVLAWLARCPSTWSQYKVATSHGSSRPDDACSQVSAAAKRADLRATSAASGRTCAPSTVMPSG